MSTIGVMKKTIFEHFYLVQGLGTLYLRVKCPYVLYTEVCVCMCVCVCVCAFMVCKDWYVCVAQVCAYERICIRMCLYMSVSMSVFVLG